MKSDRPRPSTRAKRPLEGPPKKERRHEKLAARAARWIFDLGRHRVSQTKAERHVNADTVKLAKSRVKAKAGRKANLARIRRERPKARR